MSKPVAVDQYTLGGEFVKTWDSIKDTSAVTLKTSVSSCVRGMQTQSGGYVWRKKGHPFSEFKTPISIKRGSVKKTSSEFKKELQDRKGNKFDIITPYKGDKDTITLKCKLCGKEYCRQAKTVLKSSFRCTICEPHLRIDPDKIVKEFNKHYKGKYTLLDSYKGSNQKVRYKCNDCGKITTVRGQSVAHLEVGCVCHKKVSIIKKQRWSNEEFKNKVYELVGDEYEVISEYQGIFNKVTFKNNITGHIFDMVAHNFIGGQRDPEITQPKGELEIMRLLDKNNVKYDYQYVLPHKGTRGRGLRPDFYLSEYNSFIEFDGRQHHEAVSLFGGEEGLRKTQERDALKNAYAYEHGIKMIRIPYCYLNHIKEFLDPFFAKNEPIKK